ncbi:MULTISPECIES: hypothetical protein [unclassified Shewanella]|jgi:hypothetical protein|uniref:hypothetical protein n=1 Tax=unclassified Shewanella TaxID=196818 RepID=UPI00112A048F|nr:MULTISPECIES: hypothetical protein [unclassified Shewanella]QQK62348.1 hypothetical protein FJD32_023365 [Shewanella sp. LC6]TPE64706.1 hypothetical protein FJD33_02350 [Shewanella sp. LC2]
MFKCKKCGEEVSNAKMVGLIIGQIGREASMNNGISPQARADVIAGVVSGFKIECPSCSGHNWSYN